MTDQVGNNWLRLNLSKREIYETEYKHIYLLLFVWILELIYIYSRIKVYRNKIHKTVPIPCI